MYTHQIQIEQHLSTGSLQSVSVIDSLTKIGLLSNRVFRNYGMMYHQNDDLSSEDEENLVKQTQGYCRKDVLLIEKVENTEVEERRWKLDHIAVTIKGVGVPQRWVFAVMGCLAVTNAYMMQVCLSMAITEMVTKVETSSNHTNSDDTCPATMESTTLSSNSSSTYDWSEYTQGIILSSFYWGHMTVVLSGLLAEKFGGKYIAGLGIFSTAIFTLLTPLGVQVYGSNGLIILQIISGIGGRMTTPALAVLISEWAPPLERSRIGAMVMSGMSLGTVMGKVLSGMLMQYSSMGWPIVFYFFGFLGVLWFLFWVLLCYNNPDVHPYISDIEKKYLHEKIIHHTRKTQPTPWRHILTSAPVWALIMGKIGIFWGGQIMVADLPKFMSSVLKFSIGMNGFLSALPSVLMWLTGNTTSWLADWWIKTDKVSRTNVRKILNSTASVVPAILIIIATYIGCNQTVVVILFTVGFGMTGLNYSSLMVNPNDLSPNYSGTILAIANSVGSLAGAMVPYVVGILTPNQTMLEWRIVFWITFVILCTTALIFNLWGDAEVQHWNNLDPKIDKEKGIESSRPVSKDLSVIRYPHKL